jgi:hypothetical protein
VERGVWVAARSSTTTNITAYRAPNSTAVDAGLRDLDFGAGGATGAGKAGLRAFSPTATAPGTRCASAGRPRSPSTSSSSTSTAPTGRSSERVGSRRLPAAPTPGTGTGRSVERRSARARTSCGWPARARARRTMPRPPDPPPRPR